MDQLNNMVYEQWLMVDLQELNTSCLPQEVATANKLYLSGNYALQVNTEDLRHTILYFAASYWTFEVLWHWIITADNPLGYHVYFYMLNDFRLCHQFLFFYMEVLIGAALTHGIHCHM